MLRQRSLSAIGVVLVGAVPAFIGGPVFAVTWAIVGLLGLHEMLRALARCGYHPVRATAVLGYAAVVAARAAPAPEWLVVSAVTAALLAPLAAAVVRATPERALDDWAATASALLYLALPIGLAILLRDLSGPSTRAWVNDVSGALGSRGSALGLAWFGLALASTWLTDTAAYLVGRQFGRRKLTPSVSPGKTQVGAAAGVVAGTLTGLLGAWLFGAPIPWYAAAAVGAGLSALGQLGDLGESLIKRSLGIKDMGELIPGHGGVLDRIDALLFTLPAAYLIAKIVEEIR